MNNIDAIIEEILDYRLSEIGYNDKEDTIVDLCLEARHDLEKVYEWETEND